MTSNSQIESNRKNAQRSTGPRTPEGKSTSAKNALQHGLLSMQVILPDEDRDELATFRRRTIAHLAPDGPLEMYFAELFIVNAWKLQRAGRHIAGVIACRTSEARAELQGSGRDVEPLGLGLIKDATGADTLSKLNRYERAYERGMYRALHELQRLQAVRRGDDVQPPAVLDVQVSSADP